LYCISHLQCENVSKSYVEERSGTLNRGTMNNQVSRKFTRTTCCTLRELDSTSKRLTVVITLFYIFTRAREEKEGALLLRYKAGVRNGALS